MKSDKYMDISFSCPVDSGELLGMLQEEGLLGAAEENGCIHLYWHARQWNEVTCKKLIRTLSCFGCDLDASRISATELEDQDWNTRWAASVNPVYIGRRILIRQSWNDALPPPDGVELVIDPKRAFGTGYHETTQLLAEWIEEFMKPGTSVLDVGTGSGILAMLSIRFGALRALGIDNDPVAIECALENALHNGFGPELEFRAESLPALNAGEFDVVLANLDRNTLMRHGIGLLRNLHPSGRLLVSGLQIMDRDEIAGIFEAAGARIGAEKGCGEWLALEVAINFSR